MGRVTIHLWGEVTIHLSGEVTIRLAFWVAQDYQKSLGRPLYGSRCYIGCQACGLALERRSDFTVYQSTRATDKVRSQLQVTRPVGDPARLLLPRHPVCGQRLVESQNVATVDRVVGGKSALRGQYPWQAQIRAFNDTVKAWGHYCGGVIISERFVLTAAHCMTLALTKYEVRKQGRS